MLQRKIGMGEDSGSAVSLGFSSLAGWGVPMGTETLAAGGLGGPGPIMLLFASSPMCTLPGGKYLLGENIAWKLFPGRGEMGHGGSKMS